MLFLGWKISLYSSAFWISARDSRSSRSSSLLGLRRSLSEFCFTLWGGDRATGGRRSELGWAPHSLPSAGPPPEPSGALSTPPLRLAAGCARPLIDAPKRGTGVGWLLRQGPAVLHGVLGHRACPGDPRQVHHIRGDVALGEGHTYLQEAAELGHTQAGPQQGLGGTRGLEGEGQAAALSPAGRCRQPGRPPCPS